MAEDSFWWKMLILYVCRILCVLGLRYRHVDDYEVQSVVLAWLPLCQWEE